MIMKRALTTLFGLCFSLSVIFAQEEPVTFTVTRLEDGYCCKSSRCFKPSRKVGENIYDVFLELYRFDGPRSGAMPLGISIFTSGDESVVAIARLGNEGKIEGKYVKKNATIRFVDGTSVQVTGTLYDSTKESLKRSTTLGGFYFSFICNEPVSMLTKMRQSDIRSISIENYVVEMAVTEVETAAIINGLCLELMKTIGSSTTFGSGPVHTVSDSSQKTSVTSGQASSQNSFQPYSVPQTLTLDNMLTKPMGCVSSRLLVDPVRSITENIKRKFTVDEDDKSISVTRFENEICENMRYNGLKFDRFRIYHDGKGKVTRVLYGFMLRKTDGDIATYMNRIARDLQNLGIPLSYNPWSDGSSSDTVKKDGVEYNLSAMIYTSVWDICIEIRP